MNHKPFVFVLAVALTVILLAAFLWLPGRAAELPGPEGSTTAIEPDARTGHTLTPVIVANMDRQIFLFAGYANIPTNDLWRFDGLEGQWWLASCNNPPFSRFLHEATVWGAKLFIFFGVDASYNLLADIWSYDPGTNTWTEQPSTGDVPPPRAMFAAASLGEYIYVYGGLNNYGLPGDGDMWRYTPGTGAWQRGAALTPTRYNHLMFAINGKLVVRGGETGGVVPNNVPVYDPATDTWTEATLTGATPTKASEQAGAADGARLFTYGGTTAGCLAVSGAGVRPAVGGEIDEVWEFEFNSEVTTAVVRQLADLPAARTQAAAATLPVTGSQAAALSAAGHPQVLLFGGKNAQGQRVADTLLYSTGLYTWAGGTDSD